MTTDRYGNLYANDTICRKFLKLGFPFCRITKEEFPHISKTPIFIELSANSEGYVYKIYYRPLLATINDWLTFSNLEERTKRDVQLEEKLMSLIKNNLL